MVAKLSNPPLLLESIPALRSWRKNLPAHARVGFVPTMGALHEGHLSLVKLAQNDGCDFVIVSIFVNPLQFGPNEDFAKYPRTLDRDRKLLAQVGTHAVFFPQASDLYPKDASTFVVEEKVSGPLCGELRPGHFRGVTTVVLKLFNLVQPDRAYFGQKDAQQCAVIERMVRDLNVPIEIVRGSTVREPDGLAMSSRNAYLSKEEREKAPRIYQSMMAARDAFERGEKNIETLERLGSEYLAKDPAFKIQYWEIRDRTSLDREQQNAQSGRSMIAIAAYLGKTRLIDNWLL